MNLVIDTNILFTLFWKESFTRRFILNSKFNLVAPELSIKEILKYREDILKKIGIAEKDFNNIMDILKLNIEILPEQEYFSYLQEAEIIYPDKKDAEFLALCIKINCPLWSNDAILKSHNKIVVLSTEDLIRILF